MKIKKLVGPFTGEITGWFLGINTAVNVADKLLNPEDEHRLTLQSDTLAYKGKLVMAAGLTIHSVGNIIRHKHKVSGNTLRALGTVVTYAGIAVSTMPLVEKASNILPTRPDYK
ncbi:MAG: hypothetical protein M3Q70_02380 [bacterium]|nr:hypothetical protein [bacterium]